jgi:hypothetical protein
MTAGELLSARWRALTAVVSQRGRRVRACRYPTRQLARSGAVAVFALLAAGMMTLRADGLYAWLHLAPTGAPLSRSHHSAIYDAANQRMVVFGGIGDSGALNSVWTLAPSGSSSWTQLSVAGTPPAPRFQASAILDGANQRMIVFGGTTDGSAALGDVWALSLSGPPTWTRLWPSGDAPAARFGHSAIYDSANQRMLVFAGYDGSGYYNDTWALSLAGSPAWTSLSPLGNPPAVRASHTAVCDSAGQRMVVFGGYDNVNNLNDTWALSLSGESVWSQLTPDGTPPAGRYGHSAIRDGQRMVIYGGVYYTGTGYVPLGDVWALSLSGSLEWTQVTASGDAPDPRYSCSAIFDGQYMIVYAGTDYASRFGDVWSLQWPDTTSPGAITDLSAAAGTPGTVRLQWTAPGDDNYTGQSSSYMVRYATSPLNDSNWDTATAVTNGLPTPAAAGSGQSMTILDLTPGATLYFAIRSLDDAGNLAPLSNMVSITVPTPSGYSFAINDGAQFTNEAGVLLRLAAPSGVTLMQVSNDASFAGAAWEAFADSRQWTLVTQGTGAVPRVVYARFSNGTTTTETMSDSIVLDVTPPIGSISGGPGLLLLSASDDVSGVGSMQVSSQGTLPGAPWQAYSSTYPWDFAVSPEAFVRFRDGAGNASVIYAYDPRAMLGYLPLCQKGTTAPYFEGPQEVEPNDGYELANGLLRLARDYRGRFGDHWDYYQVHLSSPGAIIAQLVPEQAMAGVQLLLHYQDRAIVTYVYQEPYRIEYSGPAGIYYLVVYSAGAGGGNYTLRVTGSG